MKWREWAVHNNTYDRCIASAYFHTSLIVRNKHDQKYYIINFDSNQTRNNSFDDLDAAKVYYRLMRYK